MKKLLSLFLAICLIFCMSACTETVSDTDANNSVATPSDPTLPSTLPTATPTDPTLPSTLPTVPATEPTVPLHRKEYTGGLVENFELLLQRCGASWDSEMSLDIPVYYEDSLLFNTEDKFKLSKDGTIGLPFVNTIPNDANRVFKWLPTEALRIREDGSSYAIWDTDTGYRFYLFFLKDKPLFTGYPIVINKAKMLSYDDFKDIGVGDSIEKVEELDSVVTLYKKEVLEHYGWTPKTVKTVLENGLPFETIHYLTDGILRIQYTCLDDTTISVHSIAFYDNYLIPTYDGNLTDHKIKDIDLPTA